MNKIIIKFLFFTMLSLPFVSCDNFIGGDVNVDPNRTNDAALSALMPTILFFTAQSTQSASVVANSFVQHIGSVAAGGLESQNRNTFAGVWNNIYLNVLPNANQIIKKASDNNSPHYAGVAKIILAYNLGLGTSLWENIPFREADNQLSNFAPKYDTQEDVYKEIIRLLDEAIVDVANTASLFKPGNDDIIYKGNMANWGKAAQTLKARYLLHLSKKQGAAALTAALAALDKGIKANTEDMQLIYNDRNLSPWHTVALANNTGNNTTNFSATFVDLMNGRIQGVVDPRLALHAFKTVAADTIFNGLQPGLASGGNTRYNNSTIFFGWHFALLAPLQMVTNAEARFIEAEIRMVQNGGKATTEAYNAYLAGITANMTKMAVPTAAITSFTTNPKIAVGADKLTISQVITEKYKAMFLHPEVWNDMRRYNYSNAIIPGLDLPDNHNPDLKGNWIQRAHYPDSEASRNTEVAKTNFKDLDAKMWIFN